LALTEKNQPIAPQQNQQVGDFRVVAYITAYRDAVALNVCLAAIRAQSYPVEQILIVDNSPQPLLLTATNQADPRLTIWHHPENIGISGGIDYAIPYAQQFGYDFLWMFDQDSKPTPSCLQQLLQVYQSYAHPDFPVGIVAPTAIDGRTGEVVRAGKFLGDRFQGFPPPSDSTPYECDVAITSGSLLWLATAQQNLLPDQRLFIDGVDLDHGIRLRQAGYHNLVVPAAVMFHQFGTPVMINFFGKKKIIQQYPPIRHYYICRNHTYLELQNSKGLYCLTCMLRRLRYLFVSIGYVLLFDPGSNLLLKWQKISACLIGTFDGFNGRLDNNWQP
jgi:rhamnosyltransferase